MIWSAHLHHFAFADKPYTFICQAMLLLLLSLSDVARITCWCLSVSFIFFVSFILLVSCCISCLDTLYLLQLATRRNHRLFLVRWKRIFCLKIQHPIHKNHPKVAHLWPHESIPRHSTLFKMPSMCMLFSQVICYLRSHLVWLISRSSHVTWLDHPNQAVYDEG